MKIFFGFIFLIFATIFFAQKNSTDTLRNSFELNKNSFTLNFEFINNLMVIPIRINNSTQLNMVLDSGSPYTIILDLRDLEELILNKGRQITIGGLGHGNQFTAYDSRYNELSLGKATKKDAQLILMIESELDLSKFLGMDVHGIVGYDVFKDFVVEINYKSRKLKFYKHDYFYAKKSRKLKKFEEFPIKFYQRKPYIKADVLAQNQSAKDANLLLDSGGWDAVWWFRDSKPDLEIPARSFKDTLGHGINGAITGIRSKTSALKLNKFMFENPTTSFPDSASLSHAVSFEERNGSIGGEILKRFRVIFDYKNQKVYLKPNSNFKDDFHYDMSGMKLEKPYEILPYLVVYSVRSNSPAEKVDIRIGDMITKVNGSYIKEGDLGYVLELLKSKNGKKITVSIQRDGINLDKTFYLEDPL